MGSYAKASEERLNERYAEYETEYSIQSSQFSPKYPFFEATNPADTDNLEAFEFGEITERNQYTEEKEDYNIFVNLEMPLNLSGNNGTLKFGGRGRFKSKFRNNDFFEFDLEDTFPTLADVAKDYTNPDFLADLNMPQDFLRMKGG